MGVLQFYRCGFLGVRRLSTLMPTTQETKAGLMATYKLTQATLDRPVEDRYILRLERIILDWGTIAMQLLDRVDRQNIEEDGRTAARKKRLLLETWQDRKGNAATFDRLITAMIDAGEVGQATKVCQLLNSDQCEGEILCCRLSNA